MIKIGDSVKKEIEIFWKKVPILLSLKKEGINERHWSEIEKKTGIKIDP